MKAGAELVLLLQELTAHPSDILCGYFRVDISISGEVLYKQRMFVWLGNTEEIRSFFGIQLSKKICQSVKTINLVCYCEGSL